MTSAFLSQLLRFPANIAFRARLAPNNVGNRVVRTTGPNSTVLPLAELATLYKWSTKELG